MMHNLTLNVNFRDKSARDALLREVRKSQPHMVIGHSKISIHICNHDVLPFEPCTEEESVVVGPGKSTLPHP